MAIAYVGVGSNAGDRARHIAHARRKLEAYAGIKILKAASLIETEPVGGPPQGKFLNTCWEIETARSPEQLLDILLEVETQGGRVRTALWGPRPIDLDLLFYESLVIDTPRLKLPHPRLADRLFVLEPLCEINPDFIHPILGVDMRDLLLAAHRAPAAGVPRDEDGSAAKSLKVDRPEVGAPAAGASLA